MVTPPLQPVVLDHPFSEEIFLNIQPEPSLVKFEAVPHS